MTDQPAGSRQVWLIEEFGRGGIARYAADVADLLHPEIAARVATTNQGPASGLQAPHEVWFPVGSGSATGKVRAAAVGMARAAHRVQRGDVAWVPLGIRPAFEASLIRVLRGAGARLVGTVHNRAPHERQGGSERVTRLAAACDVVVVHTEELRAWARDAGATVAEDLPFPVPRTAAEDPAGVHDRASLGVGRDELLVALAGNLRAYKGIDVLLDALALLPPDAGVRVVLAGRVPAGDDPLGRARALGVGDRVRLLDAYLPDGELVDVLTAADVVALPYQRIDHSGMAALAASLGTPAVASDLPSLREVYGGAATYVPPGDAAALAVALTSVRDELPRLRAALRDRSVPDPRAAYQRFIKGVKGGGIKGGACP